MKNLALIREVDVEFSGGLNILTGETGAGKSIIVDSISLALGGRLQRDLARANSGPSVAELVFDVQNPAALRGLKDAGVDVEDGEVLISRKMNDGRSVIRVNGETRTAADVREIASLLIDIHGQSEHQKLLRSDRQLELLDEYGRDEIAPVKTRVASAHRKYREASKALGGESMSEEERARRRSFLEYEVNEIEEASLAVGEDEEVEKRYRRLLNARRIIEAVESAHEATGYDGNGSAGELIGMALKKLENVSGYDEELSSFCDQLSEIDSLLNDFNRDIASYADSLADDEESFEETEERLNTINHLKSKYGRTIPDILGGLDKRKKELLELDHYEERRARLKKEMAESKSELDEACEMLTSLRESWAERFVAEAAKQFADLNFARADFTIAFRPLDAPTQNGADAVDFMIATNPGESPKPLRNVVSGGELSRLMLGIRTMFADMDDVETIIFDEVDTGISGRTAQKAAEKMAQVARRHQVLCITHLPQIAAMADAHYAITKTLGDTSAITNIELLDDRASAEELARLIGGAEITENTLKSASEMKEMCRQFKSVEL